MIILKIGPEISFRIILICYRYPKGDQTYHRKVVWWVVLLEVVVDGVVAVLCVVVDGGVTEVVVARKVLMSV